MHLYITNGAHGKYAALSYCWGKDSKQLITTTSTLALHEKAIVFDDVSKTMKEAAAVTRRLGLRYLWIDALCIIQDSAEDWETEAGRMSTVYRDAHITLSAAAAEATTQGLFPTAADRVLYNETCELLAPGPEEKDVNVRVRLRSESPSDLNSASHSSLKLPKPHISTRGWVLQEDILSHRILRFAKEEMYWLCSTQSRCECRLRPGAPQYNMLRQLKDDKLLDANSIHDLFVEWPLLVMELTHRSLTKETDRLHAISGLAAVIGEYTKDIYLAGLWASKLRNDLTWFVEESNGPNRRLTDPYAPSWSWASITGPVTYLGQYMTQFGVEHPAFDSRSTKIDAIGMADTPQYRAPLDIVDFAAHPTTSNKYGPVTSASIQIRGHILPVTYSTSTQLWQPLIPDLEYFYPDKFDVKYDVASEILQIQADAESTDAFCFLFVGITVSGFGLGTVIGHSVVCMLLQRVYKGQPVFRRCGLVFRAGYEEVWYKSIPRSTIVLV